MTDDILTPEEIEKAKHVGEVTTKMYVHHVNGAIVSIATHPNESLNYLEVPITRLVDFLNGKKNYSEYNIDYFLTSGELEVNKKVNQETNLKILYVLPELTDTKSVEMYVVHNMKLLSWEFKLTHLGKELVKSQNLNSYYHFFVTKQGDPHFLYRSMAFTGKELLNGTTVPFEKLIEHERSQISISIVKKFNLCGYVTND